MKKIFLAVLVVTVLVLGLGSYVLAAAPPPDQLQRVGSSTHFINTNPLRWNIFFSPPSTPAGEVLIIYRVRNYSSAPEEVIYNLEAKHSLGGIKAVIDYDGPFGPKTPQPYRWTKVVVAPNGEQYLYVTFPLPSGVYEPTLKITPSVNRVLGPRG